MSIKCVEGRLYLKNDEIIIQPSDHNYSPDVNTNETNKNVVESIYNRAFLTQKNPGVFAYFRRSAVTIHNTGTVNEFTK